MTKIWENNIDKFIKFSNQFGVKMLMVGGGAVNFHGYLRHSADVDFWIDVTPENMKNLVTVFNKMGYEIDSFPQKVLDKQQNISIKFSPVDINLELITNFSVSKSFDDALRDSVEVVIKGETFLKWRVLNLDDLITSKIKAGRAKDLLDIQELKQINKID